MSRPYNIWEKVKMSSIPKTIYELRQWAYSNNLPLEDMRTYIGENVQFPKAFGIYQDGHTGNFVVYKNKADGSRAVRYDGPDEAFAVNELYQKMKERVSVQKAVHQEREQVYYEPVRRHDQLDRSSYFRRSVIRMCAIAVISFVGVIILTTAVGVFINIANNNNSPRTGAHRGYYSYDDSDYYYDGYNWYIYGGDSWSHYYPADNWYLYDYYDDYYDGYDFYGYDYDEWYEDEYGYEPAYRYDSDDYDDYDYDDYEYDYDDWDYDYDDYDSDWDSDYGWDSDSDWDSGYDYWDSDW